MKELAGITGRLKLESSLIFLSLLIGGIVVLHNNANSVIGIILIASSVFVGVLGFVILSIRESYDSLITQKDEMIKSLSKERNREIKHSEGLRAHIERNATGGWEPTGLPLDEV